MEEASAFKTWFQPGPRPALDALNHAGVYESRVDMIGDTSGSIQSLHRYLRVYLCVCVTRKLYSIRYLSVSSSSRSADNDSSDCSVNCYKHSDCRSLRTEWALELTQTWQLSQVMGNFDPRYSRCLSHTAVKLA